MTTTESSLLVSFAKLVSDLSQERDKLSAENEKVKSELEELKNDYKKLKNSIMTTSVNISGEGITSLEDYFNDWSQEDLNKIVELDCNNNNLTSLKGCPQNVKKLLCWENDITSLEGCPPELKELDCQYTPLTSLEGCPSKLKVLNCSNNLLTSLEGCPPNLEVLICYDNQITSLEGCPSNLKKLICGGNRITSLKGCPQSLEVLSCRLNLLSSLEYCPSKLKEFDCSANFLSSLEGCRFYNFEDDYDVGPYIDDDGAEPNFRGNPLTGEWADDDLTACEVNDKLYRQSVLKGIAKLNKVTNWKWRLVRKFCDNLLHKWYAPDENGVAPYAMWTYKKFQEECL